MRRCGSTAGIVCMMLSSLVLPTLSGLFAAAFRSQTQQGRERGREKGSQQYMIVEIKTRKGRQQIGASLSYKADIQ